MNENVLDEQIIRSVASSTAIETGQKIEDIEEMLKQKNDSFPDVQLADVPSPE